MSVEIKMPQLGLTMEEGEVSAWKVAEGDEIKEGDIIAEITTDKLTNDLVSEVSGTVLKILVEEGSDVAVQTPLLIVGEPGEEVEGLTSEELVEKASSAEGESIEEKSEDLADNTSKGTDVELAEESSSSQKSVTKRQSGERIRISPLARKIAEKHELDYSNLEGSGPLGRIIQRDVLKAVEAMGKEESKPIFEQPGEKAQQQKVISEDKKAPEAGSVELMEGDEVEKLSAMRKVVSKRMSQSHTEIPPVTQDIKVDVSNLLEFRKSVNEGRENRLSINDFIIKATAKALSKHPQINVAMDGQNRIKRSHINIGMAVGLDDGLIVPVIKDVDKKNLETIAEEAKDLATRARENKLAPEDYQGSTFSISNLGMFGISSFTPIINQPDAAILGVCATEDVVALSDEGELYVKKMMTLSLTYDHRLIDGVTAAKFQQTLKSIIENPVDILL